MAAGHLLVTTMHSRRLAGETETFVRYGASERLELGFGYLWKQGEFRPLASYTLVTESSRRPSLTTGLFFDALGGGREAFFATLGKGLAKGGPPVVAYAGVAVVTNEDRARFIAGGNIALGRRWSGSLQYDGRLLHTAVTRRVGRAAGAPFFVGVTLSGRDALGPIAGLDFPLRARH